jgi:putative membrane protein
MRISITIMAVSACIALTACDRKPNGNSTDIAGNTPATNESIPPQDVIASLSGQDFANTLAASDAFEIASSRLAADKAPTPAVKDFARKMIDAHMASTDKLKTETVTLTPTITPDAGLSPDQQQKLDGLRTLTGAAFERTYVADQVTAHETALGIVQAYSESGDVPVLKAIATDAVAMISDHLKRARALSSGKTPTG